MQLAIFAINMQNENQVQNSFLHVTFLNTFTYICQKQFLNVARQTQAKQNNILDITVTVTAWFTLNHKKGTRSNELWMLT